MVKSSTILPSHIMIAASGIGLAGTQTAVFTEIQLIGQFLVLGIIILI